MLCKTCRRESQAECVRPSPRAVTPLLWITRALKAGPCPEYQALLIKEESVLQPQWDVSSSFASLFPILSCPPRPCSPSSVRKIKETLQTKTGVFCGWLEKETRGRRQRESMIVREGGRRERERERGKCGEMEDEGLRLLAGRSEERGMKVGIGWREREEKKWRRTPPYTRMLCSTACMGKCALPQKLWISSDFLYTFQCVRLCKKYNNVQNSSKQTYHIPQDL